MKIRNGFVSNSSSASFIIALPKSYKRQFDIVMSVDLDSIYGIYIGMTICSLC